MTTMLRMMMKKIRRTTMLRVMRKIGRTKMLESSSTSYKSLIVGEARAET
jgi:hypothetical protein